MERNPSKLDYRGRMGQRALAREYSAWVAQMAEARGSESLADVIAQMRMRARAATRRGSWILGALMITILIGLGYYVGLPIWLQLQDANKRGYETEARFARAALSDLDATRNAAWDDLVAATAFAGRPIAPPFPPGDSLIDAISRGPEHGVALLSSGARVARLAPGSDTWLVSRVPVLGELRPTGSLIWRERSGVLQVWFGENDFRDGWGEGFADRKAPVSEMARAIWPPLIAQAADAPWEFGQAPEVSVREMGSSRIPRLLQIAETGTQFIHLGAALMRSTDDGLSWDRVAVTSSEKALIGLHLSRDPAAGTERYLAVFEDRSIWEYLAAEETWSALPILRSEGGFDPRSVTGFTHDDAGLEITYEGTASDKRETQTLAPDASRWQRGPDGIQDEPIVIAPEFPAPSSIVTLGDRRFGISYEGDVVVETAADDFVIHQARTDIETFARIAATPDGQKALAIVQTREREVGALATQDSGETWRRAPLVVNGRTSDIDTGVVLPDGNAGLLSVFGSVGSVSVIRFDGAVRAALEEIEMVPGGAGDQRVATALDDILGPLTESSELIPMVERLRDALANRAPLDAALAEAETRAAEIVGSGFSPAQRRQDYIAFLEACTDDADRRAACTDAYLSLQEAQRESLWEFVAERTPQAILLLFLLATLGNLYRYNLRIAGFHASRADLLELLALRAKAAGLEGFDAPESFAALADALAADRVEFGKAATAADHATAAMRAVLGRQ